MKKYFNLTYLLLAVMAVMTACADDIFNSNQVTEGQKVTLNLKYANVTPKEITIGTRASDEEERKVDNLYIYVFDKNGKLKGYKELTDQSSVSQGTDSNPSTKTIFDGIKTTAGESYVYAVANVSPTAVYHVDEDSTGVIVEDKLPIHLKEDDAQAGKYSEFTVDKLKALTFNRTVKGTLQTSNFMMSGSLNNGKLVTINDNGNISSDNSSSTANVICLNRILAKVRFNVTVNNTVSSTGSNNGNKNEFNLKSYTYYNVANNGKLIGGTDGNSRYEASNFYTDEKMTAQITPNETNNGVTTFEQYLPENLQNEQQSVSSQAQREADGNNNTSSHAFTNAAKNGTYVVLKGDYTEYASDNSTIAKKAEVTYYIHLGDFGGTNPDYDNYDVERNCLYTYNVKVTGVNSIEVEAQKQEPTSPGSEGFVIDYSSAKKTLTLDSHYEYMVMRFYKNQIATLKNSGVGYYFQVNALNASTGNFCTSDAVYVTNNGINGNNETSALNNADVDWIEFAVGGTYSNANGGRGVAAAYPGHKTPTGASTPDEDAKTRKAGLYGVVDFLELLYNMADQETYTNSSDSKTYTWTSGSGSEGDYLDVTCFIKENYYKSLSWSKYVNDIQKRSFYIANEKIDVSNDTRSIYVKAQYGVQQYNIQTFYDKKQDSKIIAYGCETTNDEEGLGYKAGSSSKYSTSGSQTWEGRQNFITDIKNTISTDVTEKTWKWNRNTKKNYQTDSNIGNTEYGYWEETTTTVTSSELPTWSDLSSTKDLMKSCISRNRDLNGDGKITEDEIRWYAPTIAQYTGLWIGEQILSTESKLYNKNTSVLDPNKEPGNRMLYYSSTPGKNTFFSEEGLADNNQKPNDNWAPKLVRCVRNMKSNVIGYDQTPTKYIQNNGYDVDLSYIDDDALNFTGETTELKNHSERQEGNKPAKYFTIDSSNLTQTIDGQTKSSFLVTNIVNGYVNCSDTKSGWRVPNQREFCVMYLLNTDYVYKNGCRTIFSNTSFRTSWTYEGNFNMNVNKSDGHYYLGIRCIKITSK